MNDRHRAGAQITEKTETSYKTYYSATFFLCVVFYDYKIETTSRSKSNRREKVTCCIDTNHVALRGRHLDVVCAADVLDIL